MQVVTAGIVVLSCLFIGTKEGSGHLLEPNCGLSRSVDVCSRVSAGGSAHILSNPWMVMVIGSEIYGGTLINARKYFNLLFNSI